MAPQETLLDQDWHYTQTPSRNFDSVKRDWQKCSSFPTSVHVELKKAGKIKDPFEDLNEWDVQWIQEAEWEFRTTVDASTLHQHKGHVDLICEGLDTYCDVYLNGALVARTDNMFIPHRIPVLPYLRPGSNELLLHFKSPWREAQREEKDNGGKRQCWNGDANRLYSRKAQYGWGWDWGPVMMTVGPWKAIRIETYEYRLSDVRVDYDFEDDGFSQVAGRVRGEIISSSKNIAGKITWTLADADGKIVAAGEEAVAGSTFDFAMKLDDVAAWYPRGYGPQPMYKLSLAFSRDKGDENLASETVRVAFRQVKLVQEPLVDQEGTSFLFEINGIRVFCGGSNWIPADSFLTEISDERYRSWIDLMAEGNQNMLRIWGGGIYESEALYDACDEAGILVWQDFMFGCGIYPSYPAYNDNVKREAEHVVRRLRHHPSVVIFAGNNEDYAIAESLDLIDYSDQSGSYMDTKFPAKQIYEVILPEVVERLSNIAYHRGSPYGGKTSSDPTVGDIHQWNVWHGSQEPWTSWDKLAGRFVSEFGMQGYPDRRTVDTWSTDKSQLFPQSRISMQHNKADGCERRLELYLIENFRHALDMPSYIYYTQLMQAECIGAAYRLWRRNWKGRGREYTAGALVWQLNDCWPCVSWAIADYFLRPKPAYFAIKRELAEFTVGIQLWACNSTLSAKLGTVKLISYDFDTGETYERTFDITLQANSSTEVWTGNLPLQPTRTSLSQTAKPIVVQARLYDTASDKILARYSNWPEPYKYLSFPDPSLTLDIQGDKVTLNCKKPVKGIILDAEGDEDIKWSDQAIDLFPGDPQTVIAQGLGGRQVSARYLGSDGL